MFEKVLNLGEIAYQVHYTSLPTYTGSRYLSLSVFDNLLNPFFFTIIGLIFPSNVMRCWLYTSTKSNKMFLLTLSWPSITNAYDENNYSNKEVSFVWLLSKEGNIQPVI